MTNYWQTETPVVAASAKNVLRWYSQAGRLQVSLPDWEDGGGDTHPGKRGNTRRAKIFLGNDSSRQEVSASV